jgi:ribonuclease P protein component
MLPKRHRLTRSRDFARIRRYGRSSRSPLMALYVLATPSPDLRIGFSVSKRIGKATIRNHVKRLMREAVRQQLESLSPGQDMVLIARPAAAAATYQEIERVTRQLLQATGATCLSRRTPANA